MAYIEYVLADSGPESTLQKLEAALDFTSQDLASNRAGRLSSRQAMRLLRAGLLEPGALVFGGLVVSIAIRITWVWFVGGHSIGAAILETLGNVFLLDFVGAATPRWVRSLILVPIGYAIRTVRGQAIRELVDLLRASVRTVQGRLTRETADKQVRLRWSRQRDTYAVYYFALDGLQYQVNRAAYDDLSPGVEYRLYYAPISRRVLSVEPLPKESAQAAVAALA